MIETLKFICISGIPKGKECAAFTCSGGGATMVADIGERLNLKFSKIPKRNIKAISSFLPNIATISNPLDYTTPIWGQPKITKPLFHEVMKSLNPDFSILIQDYPLLGLDETKIYYLNDAMGFSEVISEQQIPGAIISTISENIDRETREQLIARGVAPLQGIGDGLAAIKNVVEWFRIKKNINNKLIFDSKKTVEIRNTYYLNEYDAKKILSSKNLPIPVSIICSIENIIKKSKEVGFPVVLKALHKDLIHKTEYGAVKIDIKNEIQLKIEIDNMKSNLGKNFPNLNINNFLIERMEPKPICELVVGIKRDKVFGIIVTIGAGGIYVDLLKDLKIMVAPLNQKEIVDQIMSLKISQTLIGYRGSKVANINKIVQFIKTLLLLMDDTKLKIEEIEVNPLFVYKNQVKAIDALISVGS